MTPWQQKKWNVKLIPAFFLDEVIRHPELQGVHTKGRCNHRDQQLQVRAGSKPGAIWAIQAICKMLLPRGSFLMNCRIELGDVSAWLTDLQSKCGAKAIPASTSNGEWPTAINATMNAFLGAMTKIMAHAANKTKQNMAGAARRH